MIEEKQILRTAAKERRRQISSDRRKEASEKALKLILPRVESFALVLSFASFGDEIDLWPLNHELLQRKSLCLPDSTLQIFKIDNIHHQLRPSPLGFLEAHSQHSNTIDLQDLDCILVPGLLFDRNGFRIGYGKGHFDRLLSKVNPKTLVFGVGFLEQFSNEPLPREKHDIPVKELLLL